MNQSVLPSLGGRRLEHAHPSVDVGHSRAASQPGIRTAHARRKRFTAALGKLAFRTGVYRHFFRRKAAIVVFHRVDDRFPGDPLTCSRAAFARFCAFFARYFIVVSLAELLRKLESGEDISRHLVITFDDGYRDNFEVAAPILKAMGLPACFFVATDFIGTDRLAWWDRNLPTAPEWMSWQQVRTMSDQGFEIGAHTRNHVDLGKIGGTEALEEIVGSRDRLASELGTDVPFFSYPYGRAHQMSEANREAVAAAGFRCCLSAHGGAVDPYADPHRLHRIAVSPWYASPYQFGLAMLATRPGTARPSVSSGAEIGRPPPSAR